MKRMRSEVREAMGKWSKAKNAVRKIVSKVEEMWLGSWLGEAHQVGWEGGKSEENGSETENSRNASFEIFEKSCEEIAKKFSQNYERTYERTVLCYKVFLKTKLRKMWNFCADLRERQKMSEKVVILKVKSLL